MEVWMILCPKRRINTKEECKFRLILPLRLPRSSIVIINTQNNNFMECTGGRNVLCYCQLMMCIIRKISSMSEHYLINNKNERYIILLIVKLLRYIIEFMHVQPHCLWMVSKFIYLVWGQLPFELGQWSHHQQQPLGIFFISSHQISYQQTDRTIEDNLEQN